MSRPGVAGLGALAVAVLVAGCSLLDVDRDSYVEANMEIADSLPTMPGAKRLKLESVEYRRGESGPIEGYATIVSFVAPSGATFDEVLAFYRQALERDRWDAQRSERSVVGVAASAGGTMESRAGPPIVTMTYTRGQASVTVVPGLFGDVEPPADAGAAFFLSVDYRRAEESR